MEFFSSMKDKVTQKWSEFTDDIWGPQTRLGAMLEASAAVKEQMNALGFEFSKREIAFGLYLDAHQTHASRKANPTAEMEAHALHPKPPAFLIEVLLWYVGEQHWHVAWASE